MRVTAIWAKTLIWFGPVGAMCPWCAYQLIFGDRCVVALPLMGLGNPSSIPPGIPSAITACLRRIKNADLQSAILWSWARLFRGAASRCFAGPLSGRSAGRGGASLKVNERGGAA